MVVFADAVGDVDKAAFGERELAARSARPQPTARMERWDGDWGRWAGKPFGDALEACAGSREASSRHRWRSFMMRGGASTRALRATKMGSGLPWPSGSSLRSHPASTGVMRSSGSSA